MGAAPRPRPSAWRGIDRGIRRTRRVDDPTPSRTPRRPAERARAAHRPGAGAGRVPAGPGGARGGPATRAAARRPAGTAGTADRRQVLPRPPRPGHRRRLVRRVRPARRRSGLLDRRRTGPRRRGGRLHGAGPGRPARGGGDRRGPGRGAQPGERPAALDGLHPLRDLQLPLLRPVHLGADRRPGRPCARGLGHRRRPQRHRPGRRGDAAGHHGGRALPGDPPQAAAAGGVRPADRRRGRGSVVPDRGGAGGGRTGGPRRCRTTPPSWSCATTRRRTHPGDTAGGRSACHGPRRPRTVV